MACGPQKREIVVLRNRFVPDLAKCDADSDVFGETVKCGVSAVATVSVNKQEHWVCARHLEFLLKEQHG